MRKMYRKAIYQKDKGTQANVEEIFAAVGSLVDDLNGDGATSADNVIYSGTVSSGTATVPLETAGHKVFVAVIGGVPTLAALSDGVLAARGGNAETETALTATVYGNKMTFSSSAVLEKLIVVI